MHRFNNPFLETLSFNPTPQLPKKCIFAAHVKKINHGKIQKGTSQIKR